MKKLNLNRIINIVLIALVAYTLAQRIPQWWSLWQEENKTMAPLTLPTVSGEIKTLPPPNEKAMLVFWATWCGPCTVELGRLNAAVKNGEIKAEQIHAISLQESPELVISEAQKRGYVFPVYIDQAGLSLSQYKVYGTPTLYLINKDASVEYTGMGLSPLLIQRAKSFLDIK